MVDKDKELKIMVNKVIVLKAEVEKVKKDNVCEILKIEALIHDKFGLDPNEAFDEVIGSRIEKFKKDLADDGLENRSSKKGDD